MTITDHPLATTSSPPEEPARPLVALERRPAPAVEKAARPWWRRGGLAVVGAAVLAVAMGVAVATQLVPGMALEAGSKPVAVHALHAVHVAPLPPPADLSAPARGILGGPDPTDPFMLEVHRRYYLYTSEGTSFMNVPLRIGQKPGHWSAPIDVLPDLPIWAKGGATWAPDVQQVAGGWALYFTAPIRWLGRPTHCIGSAFAHSPSGPFVPTPLPFICQLDHRGSIDARVFVDGGGHLVMLSKSDDNADPYLAGPDQNGYTGIYAQSLSADGRSLLGQAVKIFAPSEPWERNIVEAPDMIEARGTYWLVFSGNWYFSPSYGVGVASCMSPFGPCFDPQTSPLLGSNAQGSGPGEASLFRDGKNVYLLYNPFHANDPGPVVPRPVAMARLAFNSNGPYLASLGGGGHVDERPRNSVWSLLGAPGVLDSG